MTVRMQIWLLKGYTDGAATMDVAGSTIQECLDQLLEQYPKTRNVLLDGRGRLSHAADIRLNGESVRSDEFSRPVKDGDEILVMFMLGGG